QLAANPTDSNLDGRPEPFLQEAAVRRLLSARMLRSGRLKTGRQTVAETDDGHGVSLAAGQHRHTLGRSILLTRLDVGQLRSFHISFHRVRWNPKLLNSLTKCWVTGTTDSNV